MKKTTIILILLISFSCTNTSKLVDEITNNNKLENETTSIGFSYSSNGEYQRYQKLKSIASNEEAKNLIEHENPIVRAYAFKILIDRNLIEVPEAFEIAMKNNETFVCEDLSPSDICTEIYFEIINYYPNLESEIKQMDSLILFKLDEKHFLQYMALKDKKYEEKYNDRIISLAMDNNNSSAIFYIVENNIEVDKSKLKESIETTIKKGGIGTEPTKELNKILVNLNNENKKEN